MSFYVVDVEADGPIPGDYSMVKFAAVKVCADINQSFLSGVLAPVSGEYIPEALAVSGVKREEMAMYGVNPKEVMAGFEEWVRKTTKDRPTFISDNNGFDWMFICWYFHHFKVPNPFGFSSRRIGDLYCGLVKDAYKNGEWKKKLRQTKHTHNPVDDARGNAEALLYMKEHMGFRIDFE